MIQLPPLPAWDALHPLIVHFPIALLLITPLFILLGSVLEEEKGRMYLISGLILMALGTGAVFVALQTGEAAGKLAERTPEINAVLEHHEQLAETTRAVFSTLTVIFAAILFLPRLLRRSSGRLMRTLPLVFLLIYGAGMLVLVSTAHNGGRLVHEFGVHALVGPGAPAPGAHAEGD